MKLKGIWCVIIIIGILSVACPVCALTTRTIEAEATVPIFFGDTSAAREAAIVEAKRKALEDLGVWIDSADLYMKGLQREDWYRMIWQGYVKNFDVIEEEKIQDNYRVRIRALVSDEVEKHPAKPLLNQMTIFIRTDGIGSRVIGDLLIDELSWMGCKVEYSSQSSDLVKPAQINLGESQSLSHETSNLMLVVASSVRSMNWDDVYSAYWFHCQADLAISKTQANGSSEPFVNVSYYSDKILCRGEESIHGPNERCLLYSHPNGYAAQIALPVTDLFMERLLDNEELSVGDRKVIIVAHGLGSLEEFMRFLNLVKQLRGVEGRAELTSHESSTYTIRVIYPMKSRYLAYLLESLGTCKILSQNWKKIELQFGLTK